MVAKKLKVAHYFPTDFMNLWTEYAEDIEFVENDCTDDCDLIYCGTVGLLMKAMEAREKHRVPKLVCWTWDLPMNWRMWCRNREEWESQQFRDVDILRKVSMLYHTDLIISASTYTQNTLEVFGLESEKCYFYIDQDGIDKVRGGDRQNRVIQISRYALNKRFDLTLQAWKELQPEFPDWNLVFIGTGDDSAPQKYADDNELNCLIYNGIPREATVRMLKESKVLVSPTVFEGWGITPLEAQHCGVATVCSDLAVAQEVGYNDYMFKKDNSEDYIDSLRAGINGISEQGLRPEWKREDLHPREFYKRWRGIIDGVL